MFFNTPPQNLSVQYFGTDTVVAGFKRLCRQMQTIFLSTLLTALLDHPYQQRRARLPDRHHEE